MRDVILEAAASLFAEMGYTRASLALVADRLGVTRQAFYYHFRNKGDILGALFDRAMTLCEAEALKTLARPNQVTYLDLLSGHMDVVLKHIDLIKITTHERPSIDELDGIGAVARRARYSRHFTTAYQEGVAAGQLRAAHPRVVVQSNFGTLNSICTWWEPDRGPGAATVHAVLLDTLAVGLMVRSAV